MIKFTYDQLISKISEQIYQKLKPKHIDISTSNQYRNIVTPSNLTNYGGRAVVSITTIETVDDVYTVPEQDTIYNDIKQFMIKTLSIGDLNQIPNSTNILSFMFALNYYLENSIVKIVRKIDEEVVCALYYKKISETTTSFNPKSNVDRDAVIDVNKINEIYTALRNVCVARNVGEATQISATTTSSSSSSSCSSSSSSSSSSSIFIAYYNLR